MKPNPIALIIDAERSIRRLLRTVLEPHQYRVYEADCGQTAIKETVTRRPDVILLDLALPDMDGLAMLRQLRESNHAPILILSAKTEEMAKVAALDGGANDYMTKPFGAAELLARLRVLQRSWPGEPDGPVFINGDLEVDIMTHRVALGGRAVALTPTEEAILCILTRHAGKLVTCGHLLRCVWGSDAEHKLHDLHVYIRNLRLKLSAAGTDSLIQTEGSEGYRLLLPMYCRAEPGQNALPKLISAAA